MLFLAYQTGALHILESFASTRSFYNSRLAAKADKKKESILTCRIFLLTRRRQGEMVLVYGTSDVK